jgi:hypothetical protein
MIEMLELDVHVSVADLAIRPRSKTASAIIYVVPSLSGNWTAAVGKLEYLL